VNRLDGVVQSKPTKTDQFFGRFCEIAQQTAKFFLPWSVFALGVPLELAGAWRFAKRLRQNCAIPVPFFGRGTSCSIAKDQSKMDVLPSNANIACSPVETTVDGVLRGRTNVVL
jgi:hypothetical protein